MKSREASDIIKLIEEQYGAMSRSDRSRLGSLMRSLSYKFASEEWESYSRQAKTFYFADFRLKVLAAEQRAMRARCATEHRTVADWARELHGWGRDKPDIVVIHDHYRECWTHNKDNPNEHERRTCQVFIRAHCYQALKEAHMTEDEAKDMSALIVDLEPGAHVETPASVLDAKPPAMPAKVEPPQDLFDL